MARRNSDFKRDPDTKADRNVCPTRSSRVPLLTCGVVTIAIGLLTLGCADSGSTSTSQPGDALLRDPMNYKSSNDDFPDVSGGGIGHFDKKGFNRDLNNVLNP